VLIDVVAVANTAAVPGNGIGAETFYARHEALATESGADPLDQIWAAAPENTNAFWLKVQTQPYGVDLQTDSRPTNSETIFSGSLVAVATNDVARSCTNRLRFDFLTPPRDDRIYLVRVHVFGQYTATSNDFNCVTNMRSLVAGGGYLDLPALANVSNGVTYGTCEIGARFLNTDASNCSFQSVSLEDSQMVFAVTAQSGTLIEDQIEVSTNLALTDGWRLLTCVTNGIIPSDESFESGWTLMMHGIELSLLTNSQSAFFRFKRFWLEP